MGIREMGLVKREREGGEGKRCRRNELKEV